MVVAGATALPFAEGALKNGWIEVALLMPVGWFLATSRYAPMLKNLMLSLVAMCVTVSGLDLLLRPVLSNRLHYTPSNIFSRKLPTLPIVGRWDPNVKFAAQSYGDLAAIAGNHAWREKRQVAFQTDAAGFRNADGGGPVDLLVLGDSFGAGIGTTQERVFARLLQTNYGWRTYNLSYPGGPYDEYVNFAIEGIRLAFSPDAMVIWTIYTGNDLDDSGGETWDLEALPWRHGFSAWLVSYRTFRNRSPLNQLMEGVRWRVRRQGVDKGDVIMRALPDGRPVLFHGKHEGWGKRSRAEVERHQNYPKLERTMTAMRALAVERQVNLTVILFPTKGEVYRWILEERKPNPEDKAASGFVLAVMAGCERVHLRCLDAKPFLVREARRLFDSSGELLWWRDDTHLGERGHEVVAAMIAREVLGGENKVPVRRDGGNSRL